MARSRQLADLGNGQQTFKVGDTIWSSRPTAPGGWLACDGSAVSRTTYAALFAAIGTTNTSPTGSTGNNQAHNNMQPFLAMNCFIYAGV